MKKASLIILCLLTLSTASFAIKAPMHKSLRAEAMGNAHVALVDDKEALYFNPAGLNNINRLGNYDLRPEQGYIPRTYGNLRINIGSAGPFDTYFSTYNVAKDLQDIYDNVDDAADKTGLRKSKLLLDSLSNHPELTRKINTYDHKYLTMNVKFDAELAFHNFGMAFWVNGDIAPYLDGGLVIPFLQIDTLYVDAVMQASAAYGINDKLSVGVTGKIAKREKSEIININIENYNNIVDTLEDRYDDARSDFFSFNSISFGMDFGALYQLSREVRIGASLRDIYFKEMAGDWFIPNFTAGINYSPKFFNKNTAFGRKFNIACDYENAFYSERNYKLFSHLNFGLELEQTLLAWPGYNNQIRILAVRLAGGFKGGYPSAGFGLEVLRFATIEFATWAEEMGYYTGQDEERYYMGQISIGF